MIATILLRNNLTRQLGRVMNQERWCVPLARLLHTVPAENERRKAVVKKEVDFGVRCFNAGNIYAPRQFGLVGNQWLFKQGSVLNNSLSLTSRIGQPCFQNCKSVVKTSFVREYCTPQDGKGPNEKKVPFPGPLMSDKIQKDDLIRFIQGKSQECFQQLNDPDQQTFYFFWLIMELFYKRNGRVMMAEIAPVIFKGYRDVRRKLGTAKDLTDWCIPLARLLCSRATEEEKRKAIVKMGDDFVSRGWAFAGHICYVVARMELGLRDTFDLIGYNLLHVYQSAPQDVMERTEVYEHAMSLTSGIGQPHFQTFKYLHALKLAKDGLSDQALEYCEGIAKSIFTMPRHASSYLIGSVTELSYNLLQKKAEETGWLLKLCRLLRDVHAFYPPVSFNLKQPSSPQEFQEELDSRYIVGELLGKGKQSAVYAGVRKADGRPVALKYLTKKVKESFPGTKPREVELMEMVSKQPRCENVVELLECLDVSTSFVLVLERPSPCIDLQTFCRMQRNNRLSEDVAREIMRQVVQAVGHCIAHGVFHGDIHSKNILVNPDTLEVKLIDFGYSDLVSDCDRTGI
ncbi:uncharacterized protein LOC131363608 [Hemibagrus wyckioides]|uniref:uncharacterized protein LOC131363608 n=1 Tax=Hemibagrus wyckioides TaxID=337641 RepID=UPI00266C4AA0|nr:uncharacterized protein LOC131363608 [Hemibagrus wyckioides]